MSNSESYLWLKDDGSYENRFGTVGQIGNYASDANRLTLNRENGDKKVYTMTIEGATMTLKSGAGGYKLEKEYDGKPYFPTGGVRRLIRRNAALSSVKQNFASSRS